MALHGSMKQKLLCETILTKCKFFIFVYQNFYSWYMLKEYYFPLAESLPNSQTHNFSYNMYCIPLTLALCCLWFLWVCCRLPCTIASTWSCSWGGRQSSLQTLKVGFDPWLLLFKWLFDGLTVNVFTFNFYRLTDVEAVYIFWFAFVILSESIPKH